MLQSKTIIIKIIVKIIELVVYIILQWMATLLEQYNNNYRLPFFILQTKNLRTMFFKNLPTP